MSSDRELTTTSYAILGLLSIRPWSTYELAQQMRRNVHYFWPRAESNIYAEPKRLVEAGLARSRAEATGERPRTVYSITPAGRRALERWLQAPAGGLRLEAEALVKVMFAPYGTKADLLAHLERFLADARDRQTALRAIFEEYVEGADAFPERVHVNVVCYRLLWDLTAAAARWAEWAAAEVAAWPNELASPPARRRFVRVLRAALTH
jgi:PadR family transcriptional regulator, regulatory protein AphA